MLSVPERVLLPVFSSTVKVSTALPLVLPAKSVTKLALLTDVQAQPLGADTVTLPDPPLVENNWFVAERAYVQGKVVGILIAKASTIPEKLCPGRGPPVSPTR